MSAAPHSVFSRSIRFGSAALLSATLPVCIFAQSSSTSKQFSFSVPADVSVTIVNSNGNVFVRPGSERIVSINATANSSGVKIDARSSGNRVQARTIAARDAQSRVDYDVTVPQSASVTVEDESGQVRVENLRGNVNVSGESVDVQLRDLTNANIQAQTVDGSITIGNVSHSRLQVISSSGRVQLESVSGPQIAVRTTSGPIRFIGTPGENGTYKLANHSGDIELVLPSSSAAEIAARSANGHVTSEFAFAKDDHLGFQPVDGRAIGGLLNGGGATVDARSFSGTIRVKKQ